MLKFYCHACLEAKTIGEQSPDPRYCQGCCEFLLQEACIANGIISDFEIGKRQPWPKARRAISKALHLPESELFPAEGRKDNGE
jgi:transcriptional regulator with XRE-family HTH domain